MEKRKIGLNGVVDRTSGCLSIQGEPMFVAGGTEYIGIERIVVHNDIDYLRIEHENGSLLVSLKVFDQQGDLVCWVSRNRWWVENESIFKFEFSGRNFKVFYDSVGCLLSINIMNDRVELRSRMYIDGNIFEFDERTTNIRNTSGGGIKFHIGQHYGIKKQIAFLV